MVKARTIRPRTQDERPSLFSRLLGAVMAFVFGGLTVISLPWLLAWKFPVRLGLLLGLPSVLALPVFYLWALFVALAALHVGFKAGAYDMMAVLNAMWGTGDSYDRNVLAMAESLRNTIIISALGTFVLLCLR